MTISTSIHDKKVPLFFAHHFILPTLTKANWNPFFYQESWSFSPEPLPSGLAREATQGGPMVFHAHHFIRFLCCIGVTGSGILSSIERFQAQFPSAKQSLHTDSISFNKSGYLSSNRRSFTTGAGGRGPGFPAFVPRERRLAHAKRIGQLGLGQFQAFSNPPDFAGRVALDRFEQSRLGLRIAAVTLRVPHPLAAYRAEIPSYPMKREGLPAIGERFVPGYGIPFPNGRRPDIPWSHLTFS
jgi:hypothetical protein